MFVIKEHVYACVFKYSEHVFLKFCCFFQYFKYVFEKSGQVGQVALFEAASKPFEKMNILNSLKCTNDKNRSYVVQN